MSIKNNLQIWAGITELSPEKLFILVPSPNSVPPQKSPIYNQPSWVEHMLYPLPD